MSDLNMAEYSPRIERINLARLMVLCSVGHNTPSLAPPNCSRNIHFTYKMTLHIKGMDGGLRCDKGSVNAK